MKKIVSLLIIALCFISCEKDKIVTLNGRIATIKEYYRGSDMLVFETDWGGVFEIEADDAAMDKYYHEKQTHVRITLLTIFFMTFFKNNGIKPIK